MSSRFSDEATCWRSTFSLWIRTFIQGEFRKIAEQSIDTAILAVGTPARPTRALASSELLLKYLTVRGLRVAEVNTDDARNLYRLGSFLGFYLLEGTEIVYFGMFDAEPPKEVVFRIKLLLQNLHQALKLFDEVTSKTMTPEQIARVEAVKSRIRVEILVSDDVDPSALRGRVSELTADFYQFPWQLLTSGDLQQKVDDEYARIGQT